MATVDYLRVVGCEHDAAKSREIDAIGKTTKTARSLGRPDLCHF